MANQEGAYPQRGLAVEAIAEAATLDIDVSKNPGVIEMTITGACVVTFINAPLGYSEVKMLLTNPHTNFDIADCLWAGGTKTLTQSGLDFLVVGIFCTAVGSDGAITGTIFQAGKQLALADN
jgi:hypothetical protein